MGKKFLVFWLYCIAAAWGQGAGPSVAEDKPLPDIPALMHAVEQNQRAAEAIEKNYLYHSTQIANETDGHGGIKKTQTREYDVFWINGVKVWKLVKKDGKELSPEDQKKENEKIDKEVAKVREKQDRADSEGKETDGRGHEVLTVSRILELGSFSNPRRVELGGRDTIAVEYVGDPKAKARNRIEDIARDLVGTVWVDEQDRMLVGTEGHFVNNFKVGAGLLVSIQKGTSFSLEMKKINGEVWLPAALTGRGSMRALLFFSFNGDGRIVNSDYRKFKTTSTIVPVEHPELESPEKP